MFFCPSASAIDAKSVVHTFAVIGSGNFFFAPPRHPSTPNQPCTHSQPTGAGPFFCPSVSSVDTKSVVHTFAVRGSGNNFLPIRVIHHHQISRAHICSLRERGLFSAPLRRPSTPNQLCRSSQSSEAEMFFCPSASSINADQSVVHTFPVCGSRAFFLPLFGRRHQISRADLRSLWEWGLFSAHLCHLSTLNQSCTHLQSAGAGPFFCPSASSVDTKSVMHTFAVRGSGDVLSPVLIFCQRQISRAHICSLQERECAIAPLRRPSTPNQSCTHSQSVGAEMFYRPSSSSVDAKSVVHTFAVRRSRNVQLPLCVVRRHQISRAHIRSPQEQECAIAPPRHLSTPNQSCTHLQSMGAETFFCLSASSVDAKSVVHAYTVRGSGDVVCPSASSVDAKSVMHTFAVHGSRDVFLPLRIIHHHQISRAHICSPRERKRFFAPPRHQSTQNQSCTHSQFAGAETIFCPSASSMDTKSVRQTFAVVMSEHVSLPLCVFRRRQISRADIRSLWERKFFIAQLCHPCRANCAPHPLTS
jgi:hypothetical protein